MSLPPDNERCHATVIDEYHKYRCTRRGTVERDGKRYCKQHDPVALREKREKRNAEWKERISTAQQELDRAVALIQRIGFGKIVYPRLGEPVGVSLTLNEAEVVATRLEAFTQEK